MSIPRTVKHDFVPSTVYPNYCGECALSQSDHYAVGPDYVDPFDEAEAEVERISEKTLRDILIGPTSIGTAERLAAFAFGRGPEYDEGGYGSGPIRWIPQTEVRTIDVTAYPFARVEGRE